MNIPFFTPSKDEEQLAIEIEDEELNDMVESIFSLKPRVPGEGDKDGGAGNEEEKGLGCACY